MSSRGFPDHGLPARTRARAGWPAVREQPLCGLICLAVLSMTACNDRTRDPVIRYEAPPATDAGSDADVPAIVPDDECRGELDGTRCELPHATGVCARQQCRFVACVSGFDDCDDERGCETDLSRETSCGACDVACATEQRCARGPLRYVCTAGITCPRDEFDLDSDPDNGCELRAVWGDPETLVPPDLDIQAAALTADGFAFAGATGDGTRVSAAIPTDPRSWSMAPAEAATAVAIDPGEELRVLWSDGLSVDDGVELFLEVSCAPDAEPRRYVGLAGDLVATSHELSRIGNDALTPAFGWSDYLAAFWSQFDPAEIAGCDPCHLDPTVPAECLGPRQCRADTFDTAVCGACLPAGSECPSFRIVELATAAGMAFVATDRGLLVLDAATLEPLGRVEAPYDPQSVGGPRFVGLYATETASDRASIELFHSTGFFRGLSVHRGLELSVTPTHPDLGIDADLEAGEVVGGANTLVVLDGDHVQLVGAGALSGRTAYLGMDTAPGIQGLRPVAAVRRGDDVVVFYLAAGQLYPRLIDL